MIGNPAMLPVCQAAGHCYCREESQGTHVHRVCCMCGHKKLSAYLARNLSPAALEALQEKKASWPAGNIIVQKGSL
jgi:hypothetical protein